MRKRKSSLENIKIGNNIRKKIIGRINESVQDKNSQKIGNYRNKKIRLYLNNISNSYYIKKYQYNDSFHNIFYHNTIVKEKYNNVFLEKNYSLSNNNKTRNKITNLNQNNQRNLLSHKKTLEDFNFKKIFKTNIISKSNNKSKNELMNKSHQSCDEEISRKFYLNENSNKICLNILSNIKPKNFTNISERQKTKFNDKTNIIMKNDGNNYTNKYIQSCNSGYLTTQEKSNFGNIYNNTNNNNSNCINSTKNNDIPATTNFSYRDNKYTYKKVNLAIYSQNKKKYIIESDENKIKNISSRNIQSYKGDKLLSKKTLGFKIYKRHYASKSQENLKENCGKYNLFFNKKFIHKQKQVNNYENYKKKMVLIVKIQKWWKEMLFHMYIEKKIIYIQKYFRNYLNRINNKVKINLEYIYNINKIILIQKEWKKKLNTKNNPIFGNNSKNIVTKTNHFKLDNFDRNKNIDIKRGIINENVKNKNIYWKKNVHNKNRKPLKNNTVSNFFGLSKNKLKIKNEINFFLISNTKKNLSILEIKRKINNIQIKGFNDKNDNKYKIIKNISFKIINCNNNKNINNLQLTIKNNMLIEKQQYFIIKKMNFKKNIIQNNNYYISKIRIDKNTIKNKIILIQKTIKKYLKSKKFECIIKPNIQIYYISKIIKTINILNYSSNKKTETFSFRGYIGNSNSNKDKTSENDISNSKSEKAYSFHDKEKQKSITNYVNNLFSFENSNNKNKNIESFQTLLLKDKLKKIINKYFLLKIKLEVKTITNFFRSIRFIILLKKYLFNKVYNIIINIFKDTFFNIVNKTRKKEDILDEDEIIQIINRKKLIKNKSTSDFLIINQKKLNNPNNSKEYFINDEEGLSNYILNYFYNKKKFTNININLIKERLSKSPLIYRTQTNIKNYINELYKDLIESKICHNCFCKFEDNCDIDCPCHISVNNRNNKQKGGISIYRQKINKIIKDNKKNINLIKNNNKNKCYDNFLLLNRLNNKKLYNGYIDSTINRYDTDSIPSISKSFSND